MALTLLLTGCQTGSDSIKSQAHLFSVPYSYSLDRETLDSQNIDLMIPFFTFSDRPDIARKKISQIRVAGESGDSIQAELVKIEFMKSLAMTFQGRPVYGGNIQINLSQANISFLQADLIIDYESEGQDRLRIGSLAMADITNKCLPGPASPVRSAILYAAVNENDSGIPFVNAIVLEINVIQEIKLTSIDFGVPGIGILSSGVHVFRGADISRVTQLVTGMKLDDEIAGIYSRRHAQPADKKYEIILEPGRNLVICPLTYSGQDQPDVKKIFANLTFESDYGDVQQPILSFPLFSVMRYNPSQIETLIILADG